MNASRKQPLAINTDYDKVADAETRVRLVAQAGFTHIHWCEDLDPSVEFDDAYIGRVEALLGKLQLTFTDMHAPLMGQASVFSTDPDSRAAGLAMLANRIEATRKLGGDSVVVHSTRTFPAEPAPIFETLDKTAEHCAKHGVTLAIEAATEIEADPYFDRYPPEIVGYCFDSGHCHVKGTLGLLDKYADRLRVTHLQDGYGDEDDHRLPFDGTLPWQRVADTLARIRYPKPLTLEIGRHSYLAGTYSPDEKDMTLEQFVEEAHRRATRLADLAFPPSP